MPDFDRCKMYLKHQIIKWATHSNFIADSLIINRIYPEQLNPMHNGMNCMSQNKERSFVASATTHHGNLHLPKLTYGRTVRIKKPDYDVWSFEANMDVSNYLCVLKGAPQKINFYFYCI